MRQLVGARWRAHSEWKRARGEEVCLSTGPDSGEELSMGDIQSPRLLWIKFGLFLLVGALAVALALVLYPDWRLAALVAAAIWAFCRAYYFAFYVIEHYVDPGRRYAGLGALLRDAVRDATPRRKRRQQ
jgi:hypothetical protein